MEPVFRKIIPPWYDSDLICIILIISMIFAIMFGLAGFSVAQSKKEYFEFIWVPSLIVLLGGFVFLSVSIRLIRRKF